jgi:hypothetical protein
MNNPWGGTTPGGNVGTRKQGDNKDQGVNQS